MAKATQVSAVILLLASTAPALAASSKSTATCSAEIQQFCNDVQSGEGRILNCLMQHSDQLSDACRAHVNTAQLYRACLDDVVRLCPNAKPAPGQGMMCLRAHMTDLSSACKDELRRIRR